MTIFDIARKNIIGNFKSYLLYFFSMVFSVVIYFTFVTLQYSTEIEKILDISENLTAIFMQASILLILFVAIFILYSNSFFTKQRKKEIGLYALLGLKKKTIAKMLFYENLIMGGIALIIGTLLGTLFSKLFSMILLKLMTVDVEVGMTLSLAAIINTVIVFGLIFMVTSFRAYRMIYRYKLIELFQAEKAGDAVPKSLPTAAILGLLLIAGSYWLLLQTPETDADFLIGALLITVGLSAGTFLLVRFVTVFALKAIQKKKQYYYKGMNLITASHLLYHIKGNARTLTIISLLSAVTLSLFSTVYSMYYFQEKRTMEGLPFSFEHLALDEAFDSEAERLITSDDAHSLEVQLDIPIIEAETEFEAPGGYLTSQVQLISQSSYNKAMKVITGGERVDLNKTETAVIRPRLTDHKLADYAGKEITLQTGAGQQRFTIADMKTNHVLSWSYPDFFVIVHDDVFKDMAVEKQPIVYKVYQVEDQKSAEDISEKLFAMERAEEAGVKSFFREYNAAMQISGLNLFLLGFLGLVFLAATGSIIYFKQLTEAHASKSSYKMMHKLGVSSREIRAVIVKQSLFILGLPLVIGIGHCLMILEGIKTIYGAADYDLTVPFVTAMLAYFVIYAGYYFLTVFNYNHIVNRQS